MLYGKRHEEGFTYLGEYQQYDLWYGPDIAHPTVIARWSPEAPDYSSGMIFGYGLSDRLTEARRRAEKLGLDVGREVWHPFNMPKNGEPCHYQGQPATFNHWREDKAGVEIGGNVFAANLEDVTDCDNNPVDWTGQHVANLKYWGQCQ